jgi:predicted transcriptional regulator
MHLCTNAAMSLAHLESQLRRARASARSLGLRQSDIARATGLSQSQVSRILRGRRVHSSDSTEAVCIYVQSKLHPIDLKDVQACSPLMSALSKVWNGTNTHAMALSAVIESLGALSSVATPPASRRRRRRSG